MAFALRPLLCSPLRPPFHSHPRPPWYPPLRPRYPLRSVLGPPRSAFISYLFARQFSRVPLSFSCSSARLFLQVCLPQGWRRVLIHRVLTLRYLFPKTAFHPNHVGPPVSLCRAGRSSLCLLRQYRGPWSVCQLGSFWGSPVSQHMRGAATSGS